MRVEGGAPARTPEGAPGPGESLVSPHLPKLQGQGPSPPHVSRYRTVWTPSSLWGRPGPLPCPALAAQSPLSRLWGWQSQAPPPAGDEAGTLGCWEPCARPDSWHCHPGTWDICSLGSDPTDNREGAWQPPRLLGGLQSPAGVAWFPHPSPLSLTPGPALATPVRERAQDPSPPTTEICAGGSPGPRAEVRPVSWAGKQKLACS